MAQNRSSSTDERDELASRIERARTNATSVFNNPAIRQTLFGYCMPRTRLSLALVCKEGFEGLAGRMYTEVELRAVWSMNAAFPTRISDVRSEIMKGIDARSAGVTDEQQRQDLYLNGIRVIDITGQLPAIAATRVCRNLLDMYPTARSVRWGNGRPTRLDMPPEDKPQARYVIDRIIRPPTYYPLADEGDDDDDTEGDFQETEHEDWAVAADEMVGSWTVELYDLLDTSRPRLSHPKRQQQALAGCHQPRDIELIASLHCVRFGRLRELRL